MNILFKREPIIYKVQSTECEVYQTESYYLLKIVDFTRGKLERDLIKKGYENIEQAIDSLFKAHQDHKLYSALMKVINSNLFNYPTAIQKGGSRSFVAVVIVTNRSFRERFVNKLKEVKRKIYEYFTYEAF